MKRYFFNLCFNWLHKVWKSDGMMCYTKPLLKNMRKVRLLFLLMVIAIGLTGCLKEDMDTIVLPFSEIPQGEVPQDIKGPFYGVVPINEGIDPPSINGKFVMSPFKLEYASDGYQESVYGMADLYLSFQSQTTGGMAAYYEKQGLSETESPEVYVVGSGQDFTAYFVAYTTNYVYSDNVYHEVTAKSATVISGTVTENGIENIRYAFAILEKNDPNNLIMDVNACRVFKDGDGLAEKCEWSKSANDEAKCQSQKCTRSVKTEKME